MCAAHAVWFAQLVRRLRINAAQKAPLAGAGSYLDASAASDSSEPAGAGDFHNSKHLRSAGMR